MTYDLAVASLDDPRDRHSWSGTPVALVAALERQGAKVLTVASRGGRSEDALLAARFEARRIGSPSLPTAIQRMWTEGHSDFNWSAAARRRRGLHVMESAAAHGVRTVLHLGTGSLPLPKRGDGVRHLALLDALWEEQRPLDGSRFTPRQAAEAATAERTAFAQVSHTFTIGSYVAELAIDRDLCTSCEVTAVGSGFNVAPYFGPKDYERGPVLIVAKTRWVEKGGDLLTRAFALARSADASLELVVIGHDDQVNSLRGVSGVTALGSVSFAELQAQLAAARLFAMPALREPWGLVYLEALACKTPILGLDRLSFPEISGHGRFGIAVREPEVEALAQALLAACRSPESLARMGAAGQAHVLQTYSWDHVATAILGKA